MSRVGVLPLDGPSPLVVLADVAHELVLEVGGRCEDAAIDEVALDLAKPRLDLVEPRGVGRREVEVDVLVQAQELAHATGLVGGQVVEDGVNLLTFRLAGDDCSQETDELLAGVARGCPAENLSGLGVEGGIERERSPAHIFEAVALGAPGERGSTGSRRSSAWMAVFSSMLNTTASWGGFR